MLKKMIESAYEAIEKGERYDEVVPSLPDRPTIRVQAVGTRVLLTEVTKRE